VIPRPARADPAELGRLPRGPAALAEAWRRHRPPLDLALGRYRLRFAAGESDVRSVQRLRYQVFNVELGEGLASAPRAELDCDPFDRQCHHLMVEDPERGACIGTYRLQLAEQAMAGEGFYSAGEFTLDGLPAEIVARGVELGRACVARAHRSSVVLHLLWKGLAAYALWNRRRWMFGCSSLTGTDPDAGAALHALLARRGYLHPTLVLEPLPGYECRGRVPTAGAAEPEIPTLFRTYLRHGARALGPPAIDRAFGTTDWLTLLDVAAMDPATFAPFAAGLDAALAIPAAELHSGALA
jgi:putative hemolysin